MTVIGEELVRRLDLNPVGTALGEYAVVNESTLLQVHRAAGSAPRHRREVVALGTPLEGQSIQCLIGRDVLRRAVFVYTGYTNTFSLSF